MKENKIPFRIFILTGIFFLICFLYVMRLAGIVLTEEAPTVQDHTYTYVTVKAARGQIYDRNGVPLVTNKYAYNLVIDDQTLPDAHAARNKALLTLLSVFNNTDEAGKRVQTSYPFGVGEIPDRLLRRELVRREPERQRLDARPHTHALKVAVGNPHKAHRPDKPHRRRALGDHRRRTASHNEIAQPEDDIHNGTNEKPKGHHLACAVAVGENPVCEPGDAVEKSARREEGSELHLRNADLPEERHRERQVLSDDVVEGIAPHRHKQCLPLPETK